MMYINGAIPFEKALDCPSNLSLPKGQIHFYQDVVVILYSSDTTGLPKGVMLSHSNLMHQREMLSVCYKHHFLKNARHLISGLARPDIFYIPMYHIFGFTSIGERRYYKAVVLVESCSMLK